MASRYQNATILDFIIARMMEVAMTRSEIQSEIITTNNPTLKLFTGRMPFL